MNDTVILVNEQDEEIGLISKLEAHEKGLLHRAFSVFLFNTKGELMLQQRGFDKYHSAGLWSNTCCSHPFAGEGINNAAHRRLMEEMGLQTDLYPLYSFIYHAPLENGLIEFEFDHVFVGLTDIEPCINLSEVNDWKYLSVEALFEEIELHPNDYTVWFKLAITTVLEKMKTLPIFYNNI